MLSIRLQITSKDQSESQDIELAFDASDIVILDRYLKNHERMLRGRIFEVGFPSVQNIRWTPETGMVFTVSEFDYGHICELLHLARPLFLAREPASFVKAQAIFGKKAKETVLTKHLKYIRDMYERGDYQPYFQITINKTPLFDDETLGAWLNGVEYHQESDKEELVASLEKVLGRDVARGIFVAQLSGRLRAARELAYLCHLVLSKQSGELKK